MFSPDIVCSDAFLDMPASSRDLYFQLGMYADDDGFVNPRKIMRMIGCSEDDLKILLAKRFALPFPSGVVLVKHWKVNNLVRKDWYRPTQYVEELSTVTVKPNGAYTERIAGEVVLVNESLTVRQHRLGKVRLGKETKTYGDCENVQLADEEFSKLTERYGRSAIIKLIGELSTYMASQGKSYKDHYATLLNWAKRKGVAEATTPVAATADVRLTPEQVEANKQRIAGVRDALAKARPCTEMN